MKTKTTKRRSWKTRIPLRPPLPLSHPNQPTSPPSRLHPSIPLTSAPTGASALGCAPKRGTASQRVSRSCNWLRRSVRALRACLFLTLRTRDMVVRCLRLKKTSPSPFIRGRARVGHVEMEVQRTRDAPMSRPWSTRQTQPTLWTKAKAAPPRLPSPLNPPSTPPPSTKAKAAPTRCQAPLAAAQASPTGSSSTTPASNGARPRPRPSTSTASRTDSLRPAQIKLEAKTKVEGEGRRGRGLSGRVGGL
ncbi:hypothetical protein HDK77DRAFT_442696 [Phyllosticta capitalensis]